MGKGGGPIRGGGASGGGYVPSYRVVFDPNANLTPQERLVRARQMLMTRGHAPINDAVHEVLDILEVILIGR